MTLEQLLLSTHTLSLGGAIGDPHTLEISNIAYDSRDVTPGTLFFALPGGEEFVQEALQCGGTCVDDGAF